MPSHIPVLCNMPRAQKNTLGYAGSARDEHCANHVTPLCPELLSSSPRESTFTSSGTWPTLYSHNSSSFRVFAVMLSHMSRTERSVQVVKRNISNSKFFAHKYNRTQQSTISVLGISYLLNGKSNLNK
jgi:hypothetical protein